MLIDCSCYSWLHFENKNDVFPQSVIKTEIYDYVNLLKQRAVEMEPDCNSSTQSSNLISLPGYTEEKKKSLFPFSHYQSQSPLSVSVTVKSVHCHCHTVTTPHRSGIWEAGGSIQRPCSEATRLGRKPRPWLPTPPPNPHGIANSYLHCWNPHPLVQTHPRVPCQCRLTDSSCVGGLGAVYTECQAPARRLSVSARVAEWVVSDVGGWKWLGVSWGGRLGQTAASGIRASSGLWDLAASEKSCCCRDYCFSF